MSLNFTILNKQTEIPSVQVVSLVLPADFIAHLGGDAGGAEINAAFTVALTGGKFSFKSVLDRNLNAKHTGNHEKGLAAQRGIHYLVRPL